MTPDFIKVSIGVNSVTIATSSIALLEAHQSGCRITLNIIGSDNKNKVIVSTDPYPLVSLKLTS